MKLFNAFRLIALAVSAVWCFSSCKQPEPPIPEPPKVTLAVPVQQDVILYHDFTGTVDAIDSIEIRARVEGYLESVLFSEKLDVNNKDSLIVEKGQPLYVIEPEPYKVRLDQSQAELASAEAELVDAAANFKRAEELRGRDVGAISEVEYSKLRATRDKAVAAVAAGKAAVDRAQIDLGYTSITAPISGRISRSLVDAGNLVGAGEQTLLTTIVTIDPIYAYFNVSERILLEARQEAHEEESESGREGPLLLDLGLTNEQGYPHPGEVDYVDNTVDPDTGTIQLRGVFPNPDRTMLPGMFARVRLRGKVEPEALLVNERALGTDLGGKFLLLVGEDNLVEQRPVKLGQEFDGMRVVTSGLEPHERYILRGLQRARPGMPVTPTMEEEDKAPPSPETAAPPTEPAPDSPESAPANGEAADGEAADGATETSQE